MKKLFICILFPFFLFSCSNVSEVQQVVTANQETLKNILYEKESKVSWTKELEEDRLIKDIYRDDKKLSYMVSFSPNVANVIYSDSDSVYPEIPGFASLDTSSIPSDIKIIVNDFCKALSDNIFSGVSDFFDEPYIFNYVFFKNDLINNWKSVFGVKFPQEKDAKKQGKALFTKWILGKPFISSDVIQQPVRFYNKNKYIDFTLHMKLSNRKIYKITEGTGGGNL